MLSVLCLSATAVRWVHTREPLFQFHQYYVRTGIFTDDEGAFYSQMETLREKSDYNCFFKVSETKITACIEPTRLLIEKIEKYINGE
jgi:uncharacterized protein (UPF0332 family)